MKREDNSADGMTLGVEGTEDMRAGKKASILRELKGHVQSLNPIVQNFCAKAAKASGVVRYDDSGKPVYRLSTFTEVLMVIEETSADLAVLVFKELPEEDRKELARVMAERLKKPASLEQVLEHGRRAMQTIIGELVDRELEANAPVLMHRIVEMVEARWEAEVETVVRKKVEAALAKGESRGAQVMGALNETTVARVLAELKVQGWTLDPNATGDRWRAEPPDAKRKVVTFPSRPTDLTAVLRSLTDQGFRWPPPGRVEPVVRAAPFPPKPHPEVTTEEPVRIAVVRRLEVAPPAVTEDELFAALKEARDFLRMADEDLATAQELATVAMRRLEEAKLARQGAAKDLADVRKRFDAAFGEGSS